MKTVGNTRAVAVAAVLAAALLPGAAHAWQGVMTGFGGQGAPLGADPGSRIGLLNIWAAPLSPADAPDYGLAPDRAGEVITGVAPGGAGARNGLVPGDVIVGVDGQPIDAVNTLRRRIARAMPTVRVELDLIRRGEPRTVVVDLLAPADEG